MDFDTPAKNSNGFPYSITSSGIGHTAEIRQSPGYAAKRKTATIPSNQKVNAYLKEIAVACKIKKELTFHVARHTFATTVTLTNGVPIETVSKMLGHTKLQTTQIYARILDKKVSNDMQVLRNKFKTEGLTIATNTGG